MKFSLNAFSALLILVAARVVFAQTTDIPGITSMSFHVNTFVRRPSSSFFVDTFSGDDSGDNNDSLDPINGGLGSSVNPVSSAEHSLTIIDHQN